MFDVVYFFDVALYDGLNGRRRRQSQQIWQEEVEEEVEEEMEER
jgi:hypothetical protein